MSQVAENGDLVGLESIHEYTDRMKYHMKALAATHSIIAACQGSQYNSMTTWALHA